MPALNRDAEITRIATARLPLAARHALVQWITGELSINRLEQITKLQGKRWGYGYKTLYHLVRGWTIKRGLLP